MALKIDIPGVGEINVEGAASEETLEKLLKALTDANKLHKEQLKEAKTANKETKAEKSSGKGVGADEVADGFKKISKTAKDAEVKTTGWVAAGEAFGKSLKNLGVTAVAVATKFITDYDSIAKDPIKAGAELINTGIDVVSDFATGLSGAIPIVGDFLVGMEKATAELLKAANAAFADQLEKNVKALQDYNKVGVSFSGGMMQMQQTAAAAGLGIEDFSNVVAKSKHELNAMGLAGGDAANILSKALGSAARVTGKSGQSLRDEMFKMGYTYEEQGEVMASYMAQVKSTGKDLRNLAPEDLARGAREYAKNLKVISDITGQDAKKLMEKAREESMRGALIDKLNADQKAAFDQVHSSMSVLGDKAPQAQLALEQYIKFGKVMDPAIATNKEAMDLIQKSAHIVMSGSKNAAVETQNVLAGAATAARKNQTSVGKMADTAALATDSISGVVKSAGEFNNALLAYQGAADAGKNSAKAADDQAGAQDDLSKSTAAMYDESMKQKVLMESKINPLLGHYAKLLEQVNAETFKMIQKAINLFSGPTPLEQKNLDKNTKQAVRDYAKVMQKSNASNSEMAASSQDILGFNPAFDKGGSISSGTIGVAGENGPELISGPASVLSTASTDSLVKALDAMREMKGQRFGENDFDWNVSMSEGRMAKLKDRTKGFEGFNPAQLQQELMNRPESDPIKKVYKQWDDEERGDSASETNGHLAQLVKLMKENVTHTAKVAMNTN